MKKSVILLIALFAISVFSAQADIKFGVKAGVNLATASFSKDALEPDNFTGFQAGLMTEFTLPIVGLGMDASLLYSQQGLKFKKEDREGKIGTLEIPVNLKFKVSLFDILGGYLATGPYANFTLSDGLSGLKDEFNTKTFGFGWNFGFGVEILSHLQVGANYQLGLTNAYKNIKDITGDDIRDAMNAQGKPHGWSITAAYFF